jgi:hypothetical protein
MIQEPDYRVSGSVREDECALCIWVGRCLTYVAVVFLIVKLAAASGGTDRRGGGRSAGLLLFVIYIVDQG